MSRKFMKIITVLLFCVMVFSGAMIVRETIRSKKEIAEFDQLAQLIKIEEDSDHSGKPSGGSDESDSDAETNEDGEEIGEPAPIFKRNLEPVFQQNPDCIGWICIENTTVDYPVMFAPETPQKYLRKSFSGSYSISGTPFLNDNGGLDFDHLIIYGHNMKNGTMFSDIEGYLKSEYRNENPIVEFETAEGLKCYEVFAAVCLKSTDQWYSFTNADDEADFDALISDIKGRSLYDTGITPQYGEQILTLSTCYGPKNDDRLVVIAAEIKP